MEILGKINKEFQTGIPNREIFDLLNSLNTSKNISKVQLLLAKLKIDSIEGTLDIQHQNPQIQKILSFINREHFSNICKLTGFTDEIIIELKKIVE